MTSGVGSSSDPGSKDPYSILGLEAGASFEMVQKAKEERLAESGDDLQAKARIESSYDAVLMARLKERQLGNVSNEAVSASEREELKLEAAGRNGGANALLTKLRSINTPSNDDGVRGLLPDLVLPEGQSLMLRLVLGGLALVLVLVSPVGSTELILALSTIAVFLSQVRRGRRALSSLGWSVVLLATGLILGGLLIKAVAAMSGFDSPLADDQLEALPAIILLWAGALFFS